MSGCLLWLLVRALGTALEPISRSANTVISEIFAQAKIPIEHLVMCLWVSNLSIFYIVLCSYSLYMKQYYCPKSTSHCDL